MFPSLILTAELIEKLKEEFISLFSSNFYVYCSVLEWLCSSDQIRLNKKAPELCTALKEFHEETFHWSYVLNLTSIIPKAGGNLFLFAVENLYARWPGWGARRKWPLIRPKSNAHAVFLYQNSRVSALVRAHKSLDNGAQDHWEKKYQPYL